MARKHYNLPPLTSLTAFEAAARHLSFKQAAGELNVTPGAVSHQVKALETGLGTKLFLRGHRGVSLTDNGEVLAQVLGRTFAEVSNTLAHMRRGRDAASVSIAATTAVASLWLTPRLAQFWKEHPEIPVNQFVSDTIADVPESADLQLCYGQIARSGRRHTELFRDTLMPLCSPSFWPNGAELTLADMASLPLIHLDVPDQSWTTWARWFRENGYNGAIGEGVRVNNYTIALQAAQEGAGIVLGWYNLVRPLLNQKRLITLGSFSSPAPSGFHIAALPENSIPQNARILREWLLASR